MLIGILIICLLAILYMLAALIYQVIEGRSMADDIYLLFRWNMLNDKTPAHDPNDLRKTKTSTEFHTNQYCQYCGNGTSHGDRMSDICHNCGSSGDMRNYRSWRKIWNGKKWVYQFRYNNKNYVYENYEHIPPTRPKD